MEENSQGAVIWQKFLEDFSSAHPGPLEDNDSLPFRLVTYYLTEPEAEAECLDWALQYLRANNCPPCLCEILARRSVDSILATDLSIYHAPQTPSLEEGQLFDDDVEMMSQPSEPQTPKVPQLEASRLARAVFNQVHEVCNIAKEAPPAYVPSSKLQHCAHAIKNTRRKMEDQHAVIPDLNIMYDLQDSPSQSFYAVFDGHGGVEAAHYANVHLHNNMVRSDTFRKDVSAALVEAFTKTDEDFVEKSKRESLRCGSTGVVVLLREDKLHIAWLGDSQALLVRDGKPVTLMSPHKPEREDEKKRIEGLGGCVVWFGAWRVNGSLSVSRAIGDAEHKPYVSGTPDVGSETLDGTEDYVVLACDGMWDTLNPEDLVHIVYHHLQENGNDKSRLSHKLIQCARDNGSGDNISVVVVFLRDVISEPKPQEIFNFGKLDNEAASATEANNKEQEDGVTNSTHSAKATDDKVTESGSLEGQGH